jgi:hypothetical protein
VGDGGSWECGSLSPPRPAQPPATPPPPPTEWFAPSALFNPSDCSTAPAPSRSPPRPRAWKRLGGALLDSDVVYPLPNPSPWRPRLASAQPGRRPGSEMGAPSVLPLFLLFACCWAPGGANLSQDGE